jgi:cell division protein FtsW
MPLRHRFDRILLTAVVVQLLLGLVIMGSASWVVASQRYHRAPTYFLQWQLAAAAVGLLVLVAAMHLRLSLVLRPAVGWAALAGAWAVQLLAYLQHPVAGTHRWTDLGLASVQPSVLARLSLVVLAASILPSVAEEGWLGRRSLLLAGAALLTVGLVFAAPDLGSAVVIAAVFATMVFVAGAPVRLLVIPLAVGLLVLVVAVAVSPYRRARVTAFLHPSSAREGAAWQTRQSLIALGSGGVFGRGYGNGLQKLFFLPEPHTDFVFAMAGEELGVRGVAGLLLLAGVITWRGIRVAVHQRTGGRALLAFGITLAFALQTLVHVGVCLGLLPPKGIPFPLVSYGKTEVVTSLAAMGLLLNLSREVRP